MRFRFKLNARRSQSIGASAEAPAPSPPILLSAHLVKELDLIALMLVDAFLNPGQ